MTIADDWIAFDTNIYIFGVRKNPKFPARVELLERISELQVYLPRQIIRELHNNLQPDEVHELFSLFHRYPQSHPHQLENNKSSVDRKISTIGLQIRRCRRCGASRRREN